MSKVAFAFEKPETCEECVLFDYCYDYFSVEYDCPLIPIPERMDEWYEDDRSAYERGYNACLDDMFSKKGG